MVRQIVPVAFDVNSAPWERLPGESSRAWQAFVLYRDAGPSRTLVDVARALSMSVTRKGHSRWPNVTIYTWNRRYRWRDRVQEWENHLDGQRIRCQEEAVRRMVERHTRISMLMWRRANSRLLELSPAEIRSRDLPGWVQTAVNIERMSRGLATEKHDSSITGANGGPFQVEDSVQSPIDALLSRLAGIAARQHAAGVTLQSWAGEPGTVDGELGLLGAPVPDDTTG